MNEELLIQKSLKFGQTDTPTREGEVINYLEEIYNIPTPYVGMRVYDKQTQKAYTVTLLRTEKIGGKDVPIGVQEFVEDSIMTEEEAQKIRNISNLFLLADGIKGDVNKFMYVGKFTNLNDAYTRCAQIGKENPTLSMLKFDIVSGNIYDSLFILQTYNRNDSIVTQFLLYGEGHKHTCKIRHIVTNGQVDEWQEIKIFTSYSFENGTLYGYKYGQSSGDNKVALFTIPEATDKTAGVMSAGDKKKLDKASTITEVTWGDTSNMNNYITAGVYKIYGERTRLDDNLPILNASPGHSIAARLTVVDSTLLPAGEEICVTQFLQLSNRLGGDGNMYIRTYNWNNSPARDWWTPWQKLQGVREGYIYTDTIQINPDGGVQQIDGVTGLCNMVDNGVYSGIYVDTANLTSATILETFTLIVINDYAAVGKANEMFGQEKLQRQICQLKYATNAASGTAYIKKRTFTGNGDGYKNPGNWSDWTDIGGGSAQEVDVTDAVKAYGLPTLIAQGYAKEGVTYKIYCPKGDFFNIVLDKNQKLSSKIINDTAHSPSWAKVLFNVHFVKNETGSDFIHITGKYYTDITVKEFVIDGSFTTVKVSADMTIL